MTHHRLVTSRLASRALVVLFVIGTIGCDRMTKRLATEALAGSPGRAFLADTVRLEYAENTGGFLSLGAGLSTPGRTAIFVVATGLLMAMMSVALLRQRRGAMALLGTALFLAGGVSNWIDRVLDGRVVDFLNLGIGSLRTGIFNVADVAILAGLAILVMVEFGRPGTPERA